MSPSPSIGPWCSSLGRRRPRMGWRRLRSQSGLFRHQRQQPRRHRADRAPSRRQLWLHDAQLPATKPGGMNCNQPPWGEACGGERQHRRYRLAHPRRTSPITSSRPARQNTGRVCNGGPIRTTAGGLTIIAGTDDARIRAFETRDRQGNLNLQAGLFRPFDPDHLSRQERQTVCGGGCNWRFLSGKSGRATASYAFHVAIGEDTLPKRQVFRPSFGFLPCPSRNAPTDNGRG